MPITKSEFRKILRNAGIDEDYRELDSYGQYVYRDDMANIVVDAFDRKFKDWKYLYGNNVEIYKFLLKKLQNMDVNKQRSYVQ